MSRLGRSAACLVAIVTALSGPMFGQVYDRPLTDQDLARIIPVLKAEVALNEQESREAAARASVERERAAARTKAVEEIVAAGDSLAWLQARSPQAVAPSTAVVQQPCSLAVTRSTGTPTAVFSFGVAAPASWLALWKQRDPQLPGAAPSATPNRAARPRASGEALVQQARAFYSQRGFDYQGEPAPFEWRFRSPDRLVSAVLMGVNVLGRDDPCRQLASGPVILLQAEGAMFAKEPAVSGTDARRAFQAALDKAGLREQDYLNLKLQLAAARRDAASPAALQAPDTSKPATTERQQEFAIRRQNVELYRRNAAVLDPLLTRLVVTVAPER